MKSGPVNSDKSLICYILPGDGLLVSSSGGTLTCYYIVAGDFDIRAINQHFQNLDDIKYIGHPDIDIKLQNSFEHYKNVVKTVIQMDRFEVHLLFEDKKVRIPRTREKQLIPEKKLASKKTVMIVDDSKTIQKLLKRIVEESPTLEVFGVADCPSAAIELLKKGTPDIMTLDIHMPEKNGVEFLKEDLKDKQFPVVMISSVSINEGPLVLEALSNGAVDYIQKPSVKEMSEVAPKIREKLEDLTLVKNLPMPKTPNLSAANLKFQDLNKGIIAIGSSTGGTQALQSLFTKLPDQIPPILVVQHIPAVFSKALADRLNTLTQFTVMEAIDSEAIEKNHIYIAPGGQQMKVKIKNQKPFIHLTDDEPVNRFKPSVDYLFEELENCAHICSLAIILTGMGKDGARGLKKLKDKGVYTIAQDEASSVVFGMPKAAIELDAHCKEVGLEQLPQEIVAQYNKEKQRKAS